VVPELLGSVIQSDTDPAVVIDGDHLSLRALAFPGKSCMDLMHLVSPEVRATLLRPDRTDSAGILQFEFSLP
jgi:hypothetical protein